MVSIFLSSFLFSLAYFQPSQIGCVRYFHTWCGLSANLGCRSEMCCTRLAKNSPSAHHRTTLSDYIFATKVLMDNRKKNLLNRQSNISATCSHSMVKFGPLAAEIDSFVWGTPANFNGFRVLASLLQRRRSTEANQTLHNVWPFPGLVHHVYIFGGSYPVTEFCQVQYSLCVQLLRSPILAALLHGIRVVGFVSQILRR